MHSGQRIDGSHRLGYHLGNRRWHTSSNRPEFAGLMMPTRLHTDMGSGRLRSAASPPPGTLAANLLVGYLIGIAMAFFAGHPSLPPEWRLIAITGFLGRLTTFSTFSAEVVTQLSQGRITWAVATVAVHVLGSVALTLLGIGTVALVRNPRLAGG